MSTNIVPLRPSIFPDIRTASVHSPGQKISGSRNEVWLCPAYTGAETAMLYVKPFLTIRQIVSELVGAQIGICLGLPCPPPFLVSVAPHHVGGPRGPVRLTYGAQHVGPQGTAYPVRSLSLMLEMLKKTKYAEGTCLLDEWIANSVRGPGDLLFDSQKAVWLIDHEAAFDPNIQPNEAVTNWIAGQLLEGLNRAQRSDFLNRLNSKLKPISREQLGRMPVELQNADRGAETYKAVIEFLQARLTHLGNLLSKRVLPEQMTFDDMNSASDDSQRATDI